MNSFAAALALAIVLASSFSPCHALAGKNWTQWGSIAQTWSATSHVELGQGSVKMGIIMYVAPDNMGNYRQECPGYCDESYSFESQCARECDMINDNEICWQMNYPDGGGPSKQPNHHWKQCAPIGANTTIVHGGDASVFFHFSIHYKVKALGINVDHEYTTGEWIGPYTVMFPDNGNSTLGIAGNHTSMRYVKSVASEILYPPDDYAFTTGPGEFDLLFARDALQRTAEIQHTAEYDDPYTSTYNTCDNGDTQPVLPKFDFFWDDDPGTNPDGSPKPNLSVKIKANIFTYPKPTTAVKVGMPILGFDGPYCILDDLRGYAMSFELDTANPDPDSKLSFSNGCAEGYPCVPPQFTEISGGSKQDIHTNPKTEVNLLLAEYAVGVALGLFALVLAQFVCLCCMRRKVKKMKIEMIANERGAESLSLLAGDHYTGAPDDGKGSI